MTETDYPVRDWEGRLSITVSPVANAEPPETEKGHACLKEKQHQIQQLEDRYADIELSPSQSSPTSSSSRPKTRAKDRLLPMARRVGVATKEQFWDSNESGIIVAQTAVDRWEEIYMWVRKMVVTSSRSVAGIYDATKAGARGLDRGLLVPVRDFVLLPTFGVCEHVVGSASEFLMSSEARNIQKIALEGSSDFVSKATPFGLGDTIVLPVARHGSGTLQKIWNVARYPVPSKTKVRDTVDFLLNGSKKNLSVCAREIFWYFRRADANITRTLRRTQWVVLGSGPYETLDEAGRKDVMDHLCERYLSIGKESDNDDNNDQDCTSLWIARYEFMSNVRACNRSLYRDLVETGFLKERGGASTKDDEWLSERPRYRSTTSISKKKDLFLLENENYDNNDDSTTLALWFRLPFENGKRPKQDVPWILFDQNEGQLLEKKYRSILKESKNCSGGESPKTKTDPENSPTAKKTTEAKFIKNWDSPKYATEAKWYNPDLDRDVLLDQKRHAVTFVRQGGEWDENNNVMASRLSSSWEGDRLFALPPPLIGLYRPTMWRSYGPDEVRRAIWSLDTKRNGPQPYGEDAQAVLEDAYQFLKWKIGVTKMAQNNNSSTSSDNISEKTRGREYNDNNDNLDVLLTVQVSSPDSSEQQLVQFSSLTIATAIGKGFGGAISLFKRRVYRGAHNFGLQRDDEDDNKSKEEERAQIIDEDSEFTTSSEVALEKLSLNISTTKNSRTTTSKELEDENKNNVDIEESLKGSDEQEQFKEEMEASDHSSVHSFAHSKGSQSIDGASLASQMVYTRSSHTSAKINDDDREVDHLILVVHGIGEMMQAYDLFGLKKVLTIADCCGYLRENHAEISNARFAEIANRTKENNNNKLDGRVEYLPIEWHEAFSMQSTRRTLAEPVNSWSKVSVDDISLRTIPTLRSFANDTLMDILYFMSPAHHDIIIDIVTFELNFVVKRFRKLTGFKGDISIIGHSIGSVIAWDILDNQGNSHLIPQSTIAKKDCMLTKDDDSYRYPQLNFKVDAMFLLGSPIPVFLMIRNQEKPLTTSFALNGCPKVFNIFHPYDPVSYRIEPLIHPRNSEIDPEIMIHWNGGFRFQYQTKRLWKKIVDQTLRAEENVIHSLESGIEALGLVDSNGTEYVSHEDINTDADDQDASHMLVTGSLNGGRRIDFMLQEKEIDRANEYLAALAAHSCYWLEKDLSLFISNEISLER